MSKFEELRKIAEEQLRISIADIPLVPIGKGKGILDLIEHTEVIEATEEGLVVDLEHANIID